MRSNQAPRVLASRELVRCKGSGGGVGGNVISQEGVDCSPLRVSSLENSAAMLCRCIKILILSPLRHDIVRFVLDFAPQGLYSPLRVDLLSSFQWLHKGRTKPHFP